MMRLMLKPSVLYTRVDEGVYVQSGTRSFVVKGRKLYPLIARLLNLMDGQRSLDELRTVIPEQYRQVFERLLSSLEKHRMLTSGPHDAIRDNHPYADTLRYLQETSRQWERCFNDWSCLPITVTGSPALIPLLLKSLLRSGAGHLNVLASSVDKANRDTINTLAAEHAPNHTNFRFNWFGEADNDSHCGGSDAMLIHLTNQPVTPDHAQVLRQLAARHGPCVCGGLSNGMAIVGPEAVAEVQPWLELLQLAPDSGQPFPAAAQAVLSALLAFEALQARLAPWSDDPGTLEWRQGHCYIVRHDGSVETHDSSVSRISQRTLAADQPSSVVKPPPSNPAWRAAFDPVSGYLAWAAPDDPEYPLAHRTIALTGALAGANGTTICHWGLDPAAAEKRTVMQAMAAFESLRVGHSATPGQSPLLAGSSKAELSAVALAYALAAQPDYIADNPPRSIRIESIEDADVQMLIRLARLYTDSLPELWVAGSIAAGSCIAWATVAKWTATAAAASFNSALLEALGDALSALQRGSVASRQKMPPLSTLAAITLPGSATRTDLIAGEQAEQEIRPQYPSQQPAFELHCSNAISHIPAEIVIGHVVLSRHE